MSQYDFGIIDPYVMVGVELADALNQWRDAMYSLQRGNTRPTFVVPGQLWINDSGGANNWQLMWYVSPTVGDVPLFSLNTTTGAVTISASQGGTFNAAVLLAQAAASPSVQWNATGNPIDVKNWRMTVNAAGALVLGCYSDAGVLQTSVTFNRDGSITGPPPALACARFEPSAGWVWGTTSYIRIVPNNTIYNFGAGTMVNGLWTPGAGLWKFTAGLWMVNNSGAVPQINLQLRKNGSASYVASGVSAIATGYAGSQSMHGTLQLIATDTIEFGADVSSSSGVNFNGGPLTYIEGFRLR